MTKAPITHALIMMENLINTLEASEPIRYRETIKYSKLARADLQEWVDDIPSDLLLATKHDMDLKQPLYCDTIVLRTRSYAAKHLLKGIEDE